MKKVLSLLLVAALMCGAAAPLVYAGDIYGYKTTETAIMVNDKEVNTYPLEDKIGNPVTLKVDELVLLKIESPDLTKSYDWQILNDENYNYIFSPRVVMSDGTNNVIVKDNIPDNLLRTTGDQMLLIEGAAVGTVIINVRELTLDEVNGNVEDQVDFCTVEINIQKKDGSTIIPDQNDLWTILKIYCNELKWFWYNDVHPTFKAVYYAICDWFANLGNTIKGWFTSDGGSDPVPDEVVTDEPEVPEDPDTGEEVTP